jgi:hypothetical protein
MSLDHDGATGEAPGSLSLTIRVVGRLRRHGGQLYKQLAQGIDRHALRALLHQVPASGQNSHNVIWIGGYNPPISGRIRKAAASRRQRHASPPRPNVVHDVTGFEHTTTGKACTFPATETTGATAS